METLEAKRILRRHAFGVDSEGARLSANDSLAESIKPYQGIHEEHFIEILRALIVLAGEISASDRVDREAIYLIWELTRFARVATAGPYDAMFHGELFISADDKKVLDEWIWTIESATLDLLRGWDIVNALGGRMADFVCRYSRGAEYAFMQPSSSAIWKMSSKTKGRGRLTTKKICALLLPPLGGNQRTRFSCWRTLPRIASRRLCGRPLKRRLTN